MVQLKLLAELQTVDLCLCAHHIAADEECLMSQSCWIGYPVPVDSRDSVTRDLILVVVHPSRACSLAHALFLQPAYLPAPQPQPWQSQVPSNSRNDRVYTCELDCQRSQLRGSEVLQSDYGASNNRGNPMSPFVPAYDASGRSITS